MAQHLTLDLQINVIAAVDVSQRVGASIPACIIPNNRPEEQRRPVDFGPF